jgi:hypothetical protein
VEWDALAGLLGESYAARHGTEANIIAAYNAKQGPTGQPAGKA